MEFSKLLDRVFCESIAASEQTGNIDAGTVNPYESPSIEYFLFIKNRIDFVQWKLEDIIRDPNIEPGKAVAIKRRIDCSNQERTDLVELIDSYFLDLHKEVVPAKNATINTESPAWAIDRYSILKLKLHFMAKATCDDTLSCDVRHSAEVKLRVLREQEQDLSTAIDELLSDIATGRKYMKVYKQMKMYNDPNFNPVLLGKKP